MQTLPDVRLRDATRTIPSSSLPGMALGGPVSDAGRQSDTPPRVGARSGDPTWKSHLGGTNRFSLRVRYPLHQRGLTDLVKLTAPYDLKADPGATASPVSRPPANSGLVRCPSCCTAASCLRSGS